MAYFSQKFCVEQNNPAEKKKCVEHTIKSTEKKLSRLLSLTVIFRFYLICFLQNTSYITHLVFIVQIHYCGHKNPRSNIHYNSLVHGKILELTVYLASPTSMFIVNVRVASILKTKVQILCCLKKKELRADQCIKMLIITSILQSNTY